MNNRADIAAIAAALRITARSARRRAEAEAWAFTEHPVRGGRKRLYEISCLPGNVQTALAEKALSVASAAAALPRPSVPLGGGALSADALSSSRAVLEAPASSSSSGLESGASPDARSINLAAWFEGRPESVKAEARQRLALVQEHASLVARGFTGTAVVDALTRERGISEATLSRYVGAVRGIPAHLWLYHLAPRTAGRTAEADMSPEAWETLKADYLRREQPTAKACIQRVVEASRAKGWILPSERTMERWLDKKIPKAVKVLSRKGRDEAMKLYPAQQRSRAALAALDIVNADGYSHKRIWVAFDDGEIRRAKTVFWQDVYSSKILSFRTDKTEHTDLYRLSFGELVERHGIPAKAVLLDNTTAAANKTMSGGVPYRYRFKVRPEDPDGVFKLMGIERVMWATPGHGQAKPIERQFGIGGIGEYVDKAPEFAGAGDEAEQWNGKTRPIPLAELERVIEREVAALNARTGRRSPLHQGRSFDEVFNESYARITVRRPTDHQRRLWLLCTEPVKVQRDASITLDAGRKVGEHAANRYWSRALQDYIGKPVAARFDPKRLHEGVHVYTVDGRYIDFAACHDPAGFADHAAAREHTRDRNAMLRATRELVSAERRMSARQAGASLSEARDAGRSAAASLPAAKLVQRDFRHPLERPRYIAPRISDEERARLAELERAAALPAAVNVMTLPTEGKHAYWKTLDERRASGGALTGAEADFWRHWQTQDYYQIALEAEREEAAMLAARNVAA